MTCFNRFGIEIMEDFHHGKREYHFIFITGEHANDYLRHVNEIRNEISSRLIVQSIEVTDKHEEYFKEIDKQIELLEEFSSSSDESFDCPVPLESMHNSITPPLPVESSEELDIFKNIKAPPKKTSNDKNALITELKRQRGEIDMESSSSSDENKEEEINIQEVENVEINNIVENNINSVESIKEPISKPIENQNFMLTYSSYALGKMGEGEIFEMLRKTFPRFETILTNDVAHSGDIQMHDPINDVTYLIEVKNKQSLTSNDISKFEDDISRLKQSTPRTIGVFLSLNSPIPKYGEMAVDLNHIYLSRNYVSPECIELAIDMFGKLLSPSIEGGNNQPEKEVQYEIPKNVYTLVGQLQLQYYSLQRDKEDCELQIDQNGKSTQRMITMLARIQLKLEFITMLNREFKTVTKQQDVNMLDIEETKLRKYIELHSHPKKKDLIDNFPLLATRLQALTLKNILMKYGPHEQQ